MKQPTKEQIDAAIEAENMLLSISVGNNMKSAEAKSRTTVFALRALRLLLDEPSEDMRHAIAMAAINAHGGYQTHDAFKAMREKLLEKVGE